MISDRRSSNAKALQAFGVEASGAVCCRTVRHGRKTTIYTVGYERRSGEDLIAALRDVGVQVLVDVREKAVSRKPDFRHQALEARCMDSSIEYRKMAELGSTEDQRARLKASGDLDGFMRCFRSYAADTMAEPLTVLGQLAKRKSVALMCYERLHDTCHRSIIAEMVGDALDATVIAIL